MVTKTTYESFLAMKTHRGSDSGFPVRFMPEILFDFQQSVVEWAVNKGRSAILGDCGLGKTGMLLSWAQNCAMHTNKPVLVLTPLAVSEQTIEEGEKFGIEVSRATPDSRAAGIYVTNYERLHRIESRHFGAVVCDESSILKSFDGKRKGEITSFMRHVPYRLLCTATAAPNDYIELGTSSEALGYLGFIDMLGKFFRNDNNNVGLKRMYGEAPKWRLKGHAEIQFWRWVTSWARAFRKPSDLGFSDAGMILPELIEREDLVETESTPDGMLFSLPAATLPEQREERKRTVDERCQRVADLVNPTGKPAIVWCQLNAEGKRLRELIPDAVEVSGSDSEESKESKLIGFAHGQYRVLITKPKIGAWGLNFQHCNHVTYFPSHSYEQYYQAVRRCWRFGQKLPVTVDIVMTEGDRAVMKNLQRKSIAAADMFCRLVEEMNMSTSFSMHTEFNTKTEVPQWL